MALMNVFCAEGVVTITNAERDIDDIDTHELEGGRGEGVRKEEDS